MAKKLWLPKSIKVFFSTQFYRSFALGKIGRDTLISWDACLSWEAVTDGPEVTKNSFLNNLSALTEYMATSQELQNKLEEAVLKEGFTSVEADQKFTPLHGQGQLFFLCSHLPTS